MRKVLLLFGLLLTCFAQGDVTMLVTPPINFAAPSPIGITTPNTGAFTTLGSTGLANLASGLTQAAATSVVGAELIDSTAATSGNQQYSPALLLEGKGWGTTASTSQAVDWRIDVEPIQSTVPTSKLTFAYSVNGGTYTPEFQLSSAGSLFANSNYANLAGVSYYGFSGNHIANLGVNSVVVGQWGDTAATATVSASTCATIGTYAGHGTAGSFALTTGGTACVYTVTLNGATGLTAAHGWIANADDVTDQIHCINWTTVSSTTVVFTCPGSNSSAAVIKWAAVPY